MDAEAAAAAEAEACLQAEAKAKAKAEAIARAHHELAKQLGVDAEHLAFVEELWMWRAGQ